MFVVDCSGSMVSAMSIVLEELARSIDRLAPDQRFAIVPFRDGAGDDEPATFPARLTLVPATDANLAAARAYLRTIVPGGRSDPLAGLRPALSLKPEAVFFLARSIPRTEDTWGQGEDAILAALEALNPPVAARNGETTRPAQINAIQFLQPDPTGIMQAIGRAHGRGTSGYTVLTLEQLGRASLSPGPDARRIASDLDRAAALLVALASDGVDTSVLLGFPTREQVSRVRDAATEALTLAENAGASLGAGLGLSEDGAENGFGTSTDPRVLLLSARAALLIAAAEPKRAGRDALLARTERAAALVETEALTDDATRALALSTTMVGMVLRERAPAEEAIGRVNALAEANRQLARSSVELALAWKVLARRGGDGAAIDLREPPFAGDDGGARAGAFLLACDAHRRFGGGRDASGKGAFTGNRAATYGEFLELSVASPTEAEREAIVRGRLEQITQLPPLEDGGEPLERLHRALQSLSWDSKSIASIREPMEESPPLGVMLVIERATEEINAGGSLSRLEFGAGLAEMARESAASASAREAASRAVLVARTRILEIEASAPGYKELLRAIERAREDGIEAEILDAARLVAVATLVDPTLVPAWSDVEGYAILAAITDAEARSRAGSLLTALDAHIERLAAREPGRVDEYLASMRASVDAARALGLRPAVGTLHAIARALVEMGDPDAVTACREVLDHPDMAMLPGGRAEVELLLARSLIDAGDDRGALGVLVPLAEARPEPDARNSDRFWRAWTMTLEAMTRAEPDRKAEIRAHVTRLSLIDESLGGEPWASRLRALQTP